MASAQRRPKTWRENDPQGIHIGGKFRNRENDELTEFSSPAAFSTFSPGTLEEILDASVNVWVCLCGLSYVATFVR